MSMTDSERRGYLLACATWQDTLLQSYRTLHVTIQGFLIAAGAAVLAVQLTGATQQPNNAPLANAIFSALYSALLAFLFCLQHVTSSELKHVVQSRSQDIDYWHKRIIVSENLLQPQDRVFTHFKMWQQAKRASTEHLLQEFLPESGITEEHATRLIEKGTSHTRQVLDVSLFARLRALWIAIQIASAGVTVWFFWQWFSCRPHGA